MTDAWVLDTPALTAYADQSIYMGALVRTAIDREFRLLVPSVCLMQAHATAPVADLIDLLRSFRPVHVVSLDSDTAKSAGRLWRAKPDADAGAASAAYLAFHQDAPVVTSDESRLASLLPPDHRIYTL